MVAGATAQAWGTAVPRAASDARAYELADGLWRLRLPLPYQQVQAVNAYLLARGDGWVLVDCGTSLSPGWAALAVALAQAGCAPSDVRLLVCTHTHCDHYGLAATVVARTGCELWAADGPPIAADAVRDPALPEARRRATAMRAGVPPEDVPVLIGALDGGDGFHERVAPARVLRDGDVVDGAGGPWRVLPAPGHARNQIVLHGAGSGWMISADLVVDGASPYLEHGYGGDPVAEHLAAVERALELRPARLLPGHGRPVEDPGAALRATRAAVVERVERLAARLDDEPRTPYALSLDLAGGPGAHPDRRQMALSSTLCDLDHLERTGRARRVAGDQGADAFVRASAQVV